MPWFHSGTRVFELTSDQRICLATPRYSYRIQVFFLDFCYSQNQRVERKITKKERKERTDRSRKERGNGSRGVKISGVEEK